jgi:hypothetical protein
MRLPAVRLVSLALDLRAGPMSQGAISLAAYTPPRGWEVMIAVGGDGKLICPVCKGESRVLLKRVDEWTSRGRCDRCVPRLKAIESR